jgi:hypothetical protein
MLKRYGFRGELSLVNLRTAIGISMWTAKRAQDVPQGNAYEVLKTLESLIQGTPSVETYEVATSNQLGYTNATRFMTRPALRAAFCPRTREVVSAASRYPARTRERWQIYQSSRRKDQT